MAGCSLLLGGAIGFCFAALALCVSVVFFPLMLDRDVGFVPAVATSLRVSRGNPVAVALSGLIVAVTLVVGSLPLFIGLAVAVPLLGHSSWRFYRRVIERGPSFERLIAERRSAGDSAEAAEDSAEACPRAARGALDAI